MPGQVAVCGFDDIPVSRHLSPSLTSVRQPIQELGATAFETLHAMIGVTAPGSASRAAATSCCRPELQPPGELRMPRPAAHPPAHQAAHPASVDREEPAMRMIIRRISFYLVTAIVAITLDFFIPRIMPGNPVAAVLANLQGHDHPGHDQGAGAAVRQSAPRPACGASTCTTGASLLHGNLGISTSNYPADR